MNEIADRHQPGDRHHRCHFEAALLEATIECREKVSGLGGPKRHEFPGDVAALDQSRRDRIDRVPPAIGRKVTPRKLPNAAAIVIAVERSRRLQPVRREVLAAVEVFLDHPDPPHGRIRKDDRGKGQNGKCLAEPGRAPALPP